MLSDMLSDIRSNALSDEPPDTVPTEQRMNPMKRTECAGWYGGELQLARSIE
jgi:hypothetical protein